MKHLEPTFEIQLTGDGSHTLYSSLFGQQYHDTNGAIDESRHVFLKYSGFDNRIRNNEDIHILEIGFGTGLNLLLVADAIIASGSSSRVLFTSIEGFPLDPVTAALLNHPTCLPTIENPNVLETIFSESKPGFNTFHILPNLELNLFIGMYDTFEYPKHPIDVVFFDAFSPKANPELWVWSVFNDLLEHAAPGCVLSTYCAAVSARAAMCYAGWNVARGPGFKTRREMTIASNDASKLEPYPKINEKRYIERYANGEFTS
jgi:tRNA U34 5-methylaminomethyl-2-thiouridine-forming methyltransferase MnmC